MIDLAAHMEHRRAVRNHLLAKQIENLTQRRFSMYTHLGFSHRVANGLAARYYNTLVREIQSHDTERNDSRDSSNTVGG